MAVKEGEAYKVLFAVDLRTGVGTGTGVGDGTIVVAPNSDSWNDFGFRVRVDVQIQPRDGHPRAGEPIALGAFLAFVGPGERREETRTLQQVLTELTVPRLPAEEAPAFFSMLPEIAIYREIVTALGPDEARAVLVALRDVVEAADAPAGKPWVKTVTATTVFRQAFVRTTEAFFAWKNAAMVLRGVAFEEFGRISQELRIEFQLAGRPNPHRLRFRFASGESVLPKRFAVVIGKNGVGKSQTLGRIASAAVRGARTLTDGDGDRPVFNRMLAFHPATSGAEVFPTDRRSRSKVWYRRFALGVPGRGRSRETTAELLVQLARARERIGGADRFEMFIKAIQAIDGHAELALISRDPAEPTVFLDRLRVGGEQALLDRFANVDPRKEVVRVIDRQAYRLSSGELGFVRFAALAALHIENGSLLLFDEPETHLHPDFISQFVAVLDDLLAQTGSAAIIATHSVYFVREAFEDQVTVLRSDPGDRSITAETPLLRTFGADVGAISYFVFGEDHPSRLARLVEQRIADDAKSWEEAFAAYKDRISLDLLGGVRAEIEDRDGTVPQP